jgi:hypothetical protein
MPLRLEVAYARLGLVQVAVELVKADRERGFYRT